MEIRVIGRKEECETAKQYYDSLRGHPQTRSVSISNFYPCRGSAELFRIYIKIKPLLWLFPLLLLSKYY